MRDIVEGMLMTFIAFAFVMWIAQLVAVKVFTERLARIHEPGYCPPPRHRAVFFAPIFYRFSGRRLVSRQHWFRYI